MSWPAGSLLARSEWLCCGAILFRLFRREAGFCPLGKLAMLCPLLAPPLQGFLPNRRQQRMAGLAAIELAQALQQLVRSG